MINKKLYDTYLDNHISIVNQYSATHIEGTKFRVIIASLDLSVTSPMRFYLFETVKYSANRNIH